MALAAHQNWLIDFYQRRNWFQLSPFIRVNFLTEEVGELSRAVRALEIGRHHPGEQAVTPAAARANLVEELGDCLDQLLVICAKFEVTPDEIIQASEHKMKQRFHEL